MQDRCCSTMKCKEGLRVGHLLDRDVWGREVQDWFS